MQHPVLATTIQATYRSKLPAAFGRNRSRGVRGLSRFSAAFHRLVYWPRGQSHFRGEYAVCLMPGGLRRENRDRPRERLQRGYN